MSKHTPGPWKVSPPHNSSLKDAAYAISSMGHWTDLAAVSRHYRNGDAGEAAANARLIASAPELLAACERAKALLGELQRHVSDARSGHIRKVLAAIRAAITTAIGDA